MDLIQKVAKAFKPRQARTKPTIETSIVAGPMNGQWTGQYSGDVNSGRIVVDLDDLGAFYRGTVCLTVQTKMAARIIADIPLAPWLPLSVTYT